MPKVHGMRKQLARALAQRLSNGPAFSELTFMMDDRDGLTASQSATAAAAYKRWAESWILDDLYRLVPELKGEQSS